MWHIQFMLPAGYIAVVVFIFGLIFGSFLNVCISRLPAGKSIVRPASSCPKCGKPIKAYDNVPVVSYLFLRGRCRNCKMRISPLYPAVELLTGALFLFCYLEFGNSVLTLKWAAFSAILVVLIFTDWRERILPDKVNFTGLAFALATSFFVRPEDGTAAWIAARVFDFPPPAPALSFADALIGAAFGGGLLWIVGEGYFRLRGREGMGFGDVKMMLMAGAFLGLRRTILTILAGSLLGAILGAIFIIASRKGSTYELPFGTFLGAAALLVVFFGTPVVAWYQSLFLLR